MQIHSPVFIELFQARNIFRGDENSSCFWYDTLIPIFHKVQVRKVAFCRLDDLIVLSFSV